MTVTPIAMPFVGKTRKLLKRTPNRVADEGAYPPTEANCGPPWQFAGRGHELAWLGNKVGEMMGGTGRGICFIAGPAGIGKTELCQKLFDDLRHRDQGPLLAWHRVAGGQSAGEVWASLYRQLLEQTSGSALLDNLSPYQRAVIARHLPEVLVKETQRLPDASQADRSTVADCWRHAIAAAASSHRRGLVLWLDDLHRSSIDLWEWIEGLARCSLADRLPLLVLVTNRASGGPHRIWMDDALTALSEEAQFWKDSHFEAQKMTLKAMTLAEVRQMLGSTFGDDFSERHIDLVEQVHRKSHGIPLYVRMLAKALVDEGAVYRETSSHWTVRPDYRLRWISQSLGSFINYQVQAALETAARPALLSAAVLGEQCSTEAWETLMRRGGEALDVLSIIENPAASGVVELDEQSEPTSARFKHPLIWETIYRNLTAEERQRWHGLAAEVSVEAEDHIAAMDHALAAPWPADRLAPILKGAIRQIKNERRWAKVAEWIPQLQGLSQPDFMAVTLTTLEAEVYFGRLSKARDIYRELIESGPLEPAEEANLCSLAYDCLATTDSRLAIKETERGLELVSLVTGPQRENLRKRLLLNKIRHLLYAANDAAAAIAIIDEETRRNADECSGGPRFEYMKAMAHHLAGRHQEAVDQFAALAERYCDDPVMRLDCLSGSARSLFCLARYREAGAICDLGIDLSVQLSRLRSQCTVMSIKSNCLHCLGDVAGALALREQVLRISTVTGNDMMQADALDYIAMYRSEIGQHAEVEGLYRKSLAIRTRNGNKVFIALSLTHLADFFCQTAKRPADWRKAIKCARQGLRAVGRAGDNHIKTYLLIDMSRALCGLGQRSQAVRYAGKALKAGRESDYIDDWPVAARHYGMLISRKDTRRAESLLDEAGQRFLQLGNYRDALVCLRELTALSRRRGKTVEALERFRQAMNLCREKGLDRELGELRKAFPDLELRMPKIPSISSRAQARLRIEVMGRFRVFPGGRERELQNEEWGTVRGRGIMACLLTLGYRNREGIPRQKLYDLFWSGRRADSSLKVIISRLRRVMGTPDIIEFRSGGYRFNWENPDVALDREQYEDCWKRGEQLEKKGELSGAWSYYEQASSFYRGRYLEDMEGAWIEGSRQNLEEAQRALLTKLADISRKLGRLDTMGFYQDKLDQFDKNIKET